jgi:hypothetical protein
VLKSDSLAKICPTTREGKSYGRLGREERGLNSNGKASKIALFVLFKLLAWVGSLQRKH